MIKINIDMSEDMVLRKVIGESIHKSLVGSPAYINNEILLNIDKDPNNIILIVGKDNENDTELNVNFRSISKIGKMNPSKDSKDYEFTNFSKKIETLLNCIFLSIGYDNLLSAQNKYKLSTSNETLYSGCFKDEDSTWAQKFIVVFDRNLEIAIDGLLRMFGIKDLSEKSTSEFERVQMSMSTNMVGYVKIKDNSNIIYIFVVSTHKQATSRELESMQEILYSMIHRIMSSLPDKFFADPNEVI